MSDIESFVIKNGLLPEEAHTVIGYFCVYCQSEVGEQHTLSCPTGERYRYFQRLGESGISIPDYMNYTGYTMTEEMKEEMMIVERNIEGLDYTDPVHSSPSPAALLGRKGGQAKTPAKTRASQSNGKKGGRPKKNRDTSAFD